MSEDAFEFAKFAAKFNKSYSTVQEYQYRMALFLETEEFMIAHAIENPNATYKLAHNKMSDWTDAEYKAILGGAGESNFNAEQHVITGSTPSTWDWRDHNAVNSIKDQGSCGSCWSFSATSAVESAHAIASGSLKSFAEQTLVDCDTNSHGCNGGDKVGGMAFYESHNTILENNYPYTARTGTCQYSSKTHTSVNVSKVVAGGVDAPDTMRSAVAKAPNAVSIQADQPVFQSYSSGIFNSAACGTQHDHATIVVGYGEENGTEYWIMRNSWGASWGEGGYMRMEIQDGKGVCGVQMSPHYAVAN